MFGVGEFVEESFQTLVIRELSLFTRLSIPSFPSEDPLVWWHNHEGQFPNVAFLPNKFSTSQGHRLKQKECLILLEY